MLPVRNPRSATGSSVARTGPCVLAGINATYFGEHVVDQSAGRGKGDAGADAVRRLIGAEDRRQPLGEPSLDALRGDGDDLLSEGVRQRARQQIRQAGGEQRGPLGPVDVEHLACISDGRPSAPAFAAARPPDLDG